jgi:hypothetical protein
MEAKDLRIGNYFNAKKPRHNEKYVIVESIDFYEINSSFRPYKIDDIEPIPLTDEWLVKFGLIKKYLENPFEESGFELKEDGTKFYWWADGGTFNIEINPNGEVWFELYSHYNHIKYVHQLQNLYYSLTGEELVIK